MRPITRRRIFLLALVLIALIPVLLQGCASVDVQCHMRADYVTIARPATHGEVALAWAFGQPFTGDHIGSTTFVGEKAVISLQVAPPAFDDICGQAKLGHQVLEAMGGRHK